VVTVAIVVVAIALFSGARSGDRKAAIVDQLSLTFPNPAFVERATDILEQSGHDVDYFPGEAVTVRFFQGLPSRGYDFILLRSHSARVMDEGTKTDDVALFTGEMIDLSYYSIVGVPDPAATAAAEAKARSGIGSSGSDPADRHSPDEVSRLIPVYYDPESGELPFFGVRPAFIEQDSEGTFKDSTVVVLMGCDGLRSARMAEAFVRKGARTFVSWDQPVSASHTDGATERLLEYMLLDGLPVEDAVERTMAEVGPDPRYDAELTLYPGPADWGYGD